MTSQIQNHQNIQEYSKARLSLTVTDFRRSFVSNMVIGNRVK